MPGRIMFRKYSNVWSPILNSFWQTHLILFFIAKLIHPELIFKPGLVVFCHPVTALFVWVFANNREFSSWKLICSTKLDWTKCHFINIINFNNLLLFEINCFFLQILQKETKRSKFFLLSILMKSHSYFLYCRMFTFYNAHILCDMVKHELRVESLKARVKIQKCEFKSTSYEFKSTSYEFESTSYEFKSTSYEFESTSSKVIKSMKIQVNSLQIYTRN